MPWRFDREYYVKEIDKARRDLRARMVSKNCAPVMLRLAWHDAGTYDKSTNTGGPNGSIRNEEYSHGSNNEMKIALDFCGHVLEILCSISQELQTPTQLQMTQDVGAKRIWSCSCCCNGNTELFVRKSQENQVNGDPGVNHCYLVYFCSQGVGYLI